MPAVDPIKTVPPARLGRRRRQWGARSAVVTLVSVTVGFLTNVVSSGNHSLAAVAGLVCAVGIFLSVVWWDSAHRAAHSTAASIVVDQQIGTARDSTMTGIETAGETSGDQDVRQRVELAERSDIHGVRHVPPGSSQGRT